MTAPEWHDRTRSGNSCPMRGIIFFLLFALTISPLSGAPASNADENAIRQLIQRYVDARNHMDEAALRGLFTPDADQLVSTGQWRRGLDNLLEGAMASSRKENGKSAVNIESVRILGKDTAIADGRYETSGADAAAPRKMWSTFVMRRVPEGWRITAIRNMLPTSATPIPANQK
jgi:uncharacterized protein (TIGR02246 family)